jgi:hypothetical protein
LKLLPEILRVLFVDRWSIEEVPGIGSIAGERSSSQASAIWLGVTP